MFPTNNGFDEFFGNHYHLNAEEEPENPDYPKDPEFKKKFGPRGVIHSWALPNGTQKIEDTGPLTRKRTETEVTLDFIERAHKDGKPFFVWWNSTRMQLGRRLSRTDADPLACRDQAGHGDQRPLCSRGYAADARDCGGRSRHRGEALKGTALGDRSYKVHLDGYDLGLLFRGESSSPRRDFIYWTDDGNVAALRYDNWKVTFLEQKAEGLRVWQEPFDVLRAPLLTNLRMDPFERARHEDAMGYQRWYMERSSPLRPRPPSSRGGSKASRSSRRARNPAASTSTGSWKP
jgi:arylsulfatase A-like enzyme